jgi:hypothetical protein
VIWNSARARYEIKVTCKLKDIWEKHVFIAISADGTAIRNRWLDICNFNIKQIDVMNFEPNGNINYSRSKGTRNEFGVDANEDIYYGHGDTDHQSEPCLI